MADTVETQSDSSPSPSRLPLMLAIINSVALLGAAGTAVYTKLIFKRPVITEPAERTRLAAVDKAGGVKAGDTSQVINFESMTVNIAPSLAPGADPTTDPAPQGGKVHYLTIALSVVIPDGSRKAEFESLRPLILDKFLSVLGRKQFHEINSIQGRYVLRTELLDAINSLDPKRKQDTQAPPMASEIYFTQFIVQ